MRFVAIQDWFLKLNLIICLLLPLHNHQDVFMFKYLLKCYSVQDTGR